MNCYLGAIQAAQALRNSEDIWRTRSGKERKAFAELCLNISDILDQIHITLRRHRNPDLLLRQLDRYAKRLPELCPHLKDPDPVILSKKLVARQPAGELYRLYSHNRICRKLPKLYAKAADEFELLSDDIDLLDYYTRNFFNSSALPGKQSAASDHTPAFGMRPQSRLP